MGILGTRTGRRVERRKKHDELLSSVVRETPVPAAVELLRSNSRFVFPSGTAWVILVLTADAIGGLSRRHGRDEAKGSIIELIGSDQIHTVATAEMLQEQVFGIIPTDETLARMDEYSLLTGAEYAWAVVWQKNSGELLVDLVNPATFAQARAVAGGTSNLQDAVGRQAWAEHSGLVDPDDDDQGNDPADASTAGADAEGLREKGVDEDEIFDPLPGQAAAEADEPVFSDTPDEDEAAGTPVFDDDTGAQAPVDDLGGAQVDAGTVLHEADHDDGYLSDDVAGPEDVVSLADQDQVREVIARRFLTEDLDLTIRLDEFDATFAIGAPVVQIALPDGATEWLGDQLAQLGRQANADLTRLRFAHEDELRALYVNLMSTHAEQVIREVATDREGARYTLLNEAAEAEHQERLAEKDHRIRARRTEILEDYEEQAAKHARQAAMQAEIHYKERNRPKMERAQADAVAEIERGLEDDRSRDQQEILRIRRQHAALKLQTGQTRIFEVLQEHQSRYLAEEEACLTRWKVEIQHVVDDYRKADIAQAETLAEHHRITDEIGELRQQQESLLQSMRTEHAGRIQRMEDELERDRNDTVARMTARDEEWQHSLNLEREKTRSQTARVADLLRQVETTEDAVGRRYEARVTELTADKESYANAMARTAEIHGRSGKAYAVLAVAISLLTSIAGFIVGTQV
ncbi:hypothetical protein C8K30_1011013 [Promicromonospora sp. AC04]|uniref:hypothetical protein n=1 Tax=Promicromonospora sp. AC04 TaxID=2135723 RepID=UPI000D4A0429|nr:hypothetical protein [Promicromonospora sp. AC04]PUB32487.1 hypothetical protein C8K30_1011013 [Promicromonospora sp. AC04]